MLYRTLGRTNLNTSVFTLGGMRWIDGWNEPYHEISDETLKQACEVTKHCLDKGINHIETARAYGKSEFIFGKVFNLLSIKKNNLIVTTKVRLKDSETVYSQILESLERLQINYVNIVDIHGINNDLDYNKVFSKDGTLKGLQKARKEGLVKHIGFSTHGPLDLILKTIITGEFDVVNLHYYFTFQTNYPAISLANALKMGVFIISPNDKGGMLYKPSQKLLNLCNPLHPIVFNNRFLLEDHGIHTISLGITKTEMLNIHLESIQNKNTNSSNSVRDEPFMGKLERDIKLKLEKELNNTPDYCTICGFCLPCPVKINIPEVLRLRNLFIAFDMKEFAVKRYNEMKPDDPWVTGESADKCVNCNECLPRCPQRLTIPSLLKNTHKLFKNAITKY